MECVGTGNTNISKSKMTETKIGDLYLGLFKQSSSLVAQTAKNHPAMQETRVRSLSWEDTPGEGNGYPTPVSCLENPMNRVAWWATVHIRVTESDMTERLTHKKCSLLGPVF